MKLSTRPCVSLTAVLIYILGTIKASNAEVSGEIEDAIEEQGGAVLRFNAIAKKCSNTSLEQLKARLDAPYLIKPTLEEKCYIKCFFDYIGLLVGYDTNYIQLLKLTLGEEAYYRFRYECGDFTVYLDQHPCEAIWQYFRCYIIIKRSVGAANATNAPNATNSPNATDK